MTTGDSTGARTEPAGTVAPRSQRGSVWRQMFTPAQYPAPKLDGLGVAWRYTGASIMYLIFAGGFIDGVWPQSLPSADSTPEPGYDGEDGPTVYRDSVAAQTPIQFVILDLFLGALAFVIIRFRRRWPLATVLVLFTMSVFSVSGSAFAVWAFVSLASRRNWRQIIIAIAYSALVSTASLLFIPWHQVDGEIFGVPTAVLMGILANFVAALIGAYYGVRQDRAAGVLDRAENADRDLELAVLGERNRIAREMHDVLAHRISLVSMHAGALAFRTDLPPEQTRDIARVIQENAHASLGELRAVLSTLRDGQLDAAGAPAAPQPTLVDLPELLAQARSLGQKISLESSIDPAGVDQVTSRHAYRIVQECLTNARKHAPYSTVLLTLGGAPGSGLLIRSENPLAPASRATVPGAGLGLIGVRERVMMLGGELDAGADATRFVLEARLPWPPHR